ncbi:sodium/proline symporter [Pontimicrobium aquaticum]|uniref:Sodium/proline symporter n=1 Tax=Pontimicrobium aquaticum TaxID=2565367 RepID=A0A4U0EX23_9FLAO|nr:sodium/proline symporter [Pontimicrobium aquaticum]TJY36493.1 sodium/proline symporter [Pontimicrobium aquaticum]
MENQTIILIVMSVYMILLITWGIYQGKKVKTGSDFAIAGRKLPGWVAALSERATGESSWALLGLPGAAYATGLMEIWTAVGCVSGIIVAWVLLASRLRNEAEKYEVDTFTDYIAKRHGEVGKLIRIVGSLTIVFFFFFYVGAQFIGGGKTLNSLFGVNQDLAMIIIVILVIPYTIYGGFRSVTYTDVIQAIIMIITLIITPIAGLIYLSNLPEGTVFAHTISDALIKSGESYSTMTGGAVVKNDSALFGFLSNIFPNSLSIVKGLGTGIIIAGAFSWFFGYLGGQPQLTMRFMAIKDEKNAKIARNIGVIWTIIAYTGALLVGWIGIALFGPEGLQDQETVMPEVLTTVFNPVVSGILITGVLAAIISTANSLLILSATELSENIIKSGDTSSLIDSKKSLFQSRLVTAILSLVALLLAYLSPSDLVYAIVGYVWAGIGSTFSVVILLTLFWKRFHGIPALLTIIVGLIFTIFWIVSGMDAIVSSRLLTFVVAVLTAVVSTYLIKKKDS